MNRPGRPTTDPEVLVALWLLATVEGIGSARRLARLCQEHDAYRWVRGHVPINYHMLSDFRVAYQEALDDLLTQIIAALMAAGAVRLRTGQPPNCYLIDGGFATREDITALEQGAVSVYAPVRLPRNKQSISDTCPAMEMDPMWCGGDNGWPPKVPKPFRNVASFNEH